MTDPFEVLNLSPDADEAAIRRRYLELVREFTPERAPEQFARIRAAYDQVRDPLQRLESQLFALKTEDSIDAIVADLSDRIVKSKNLAETLLKLADRP